MFYSDCERNSFGLRRKIFAALSKLLCTYPELLFEESQYFWEKHLLLFLFSDFELKYMESGKKLSMVVNVFSHVSRETL